ncbi:aminomethyl-transferring glycine dehydrogenase [Suttonella sp. R2A3]|uniref:aminomethyl-transferring glycine dehydrogenase n=1 Tax=Suttonella sp. R2A3 TaxID=2908648 RepID=UPI001F423E17|nr:aminomethyl-transferring glycine dehydrogenase [Suttonella sp. R2A3]UJF24914.1 aminomethyl-transferring glycine dehydrogenase [Suttonella sp. R2A3]
MNDSPFVTRHIGPSPEDEQKMLDQLGFASLDAFVDQLVPNDIRRQQALDIGRAMSEEAALERLKMMADKNQVFRSLIGQGYYNCHVPNVIARNVLENPAWYTSYTPYQPEISQGRLEALLNFQTMVSDLTGMDIANASLLDEATAAAEAMTLAKRQSKAKSDVFIVDRGVHPQTLAVVETRAGFLGIEVRVHDCVNGLPEDGFFGVLVQYPNSDGRIVDWQALVEQAHAQKAVVAVATDLLALTLLSPPGEWGADIVIGNSQRFGVPLGFGGPHAAFMATREAYKRTMPGRIVGVSIDSHGKPAYRLALQTREQHIRREKATSNICTAQALLAIMAGCYAVYHGAEGLKAIAQRVHGLTTRLAATLRDQGVNVDHEAFFDTLSFTCANQAEADAVIERAQTLQFNLRRIDERRIGLSLDERSDEAEVEALVSIISNRSLATLAESGNALPQALVRQSGFLTHPVFARHRSETEMMRYLRRLSDYDLALDRAMIPLGSCTMKLNAASEMVPVSWPNFSDIHPFAPAEQTVGYRELFSDLETMLAKATGYHAISLQPNSGASGEYAGLLAILAYHESRGEAHRDVCLIPSSAHGTNPASAALAGMSVVIVACDSDGNIDIEDLKAKLDTHRDKLAAIMITYPSTHGVFEHHVREVCQLVHDAGGQVYIDGANFNALLGLASPGGFGGDVSHLNLHKTFAIPHGGGGPGVGPIGVGEHLAPFLPGHGQVDVGERHGKVVSAAPWGSALVCVIPWMYMRMMGSKGLKKASAVALLNANYIALRLREGFDVLYTDEQGHVAHECIIDVRPFKDHQGISVDDIAKRLMDFGFHAPTMSFPVPGTLMIEPTESESLAELDRFCAAMLAIRGEIQNVADGVWPQDDNPLVHAPHTLADITGDWDRAYDRKTAIFPLEGMNPAKYFTPVNRVDNAWGDRNLQCSCPSIESYQ